MAFRRSWRGHRSYGTWRSPVAHLNGVQGVAGSNPAVPTGMGESPDRIAVVGALAFPPGRRGGRRAGSTPPCRGRECAGPHAPAGYLARRVRRNPSSAARRSRRTLSSGVWPSARSQAPGTIAADQGTLHSRGMRSGLIVAPDLDHELPFPAPDPAGSGAQDHLLAVVLLVDGRCRSPSAASSSGRRWVMTKRRVDLAVLDALQQRLHVALHVALAGADGERAVHQRAHRELVDEAAVDADAPRRCRRCGRP